METLLTTTDRDRGLDRPLKIVFLDYVLDLDKPGRSGLSDIVWDMAAALTAQGHEVHVVGPYPQSAAPEPGITVHRIRVPPFGYRWHAGFLWICQRMARVAARLQPDIVHAPDYISTAVFVTLNPNMSAQTVVTVPGNVYDRLSTPGAFKTTPLGAAILKWAAQQTARSGPTVIAISRDMKRWWEWTGSYPPRTPWIPLGIDTGRFRTVPDARRTLQRDPDTPFFLYVGRYAVEKGILDLLDALGELRRQRPDAPFTAALVGRGDQLERIERRRRELGLEDVVEVHGWLAQDDLATWYSAADLFLMPSRNEPLGKVMLEAMACGTPVLASDSAGPLDHIDEGVNGFLFPRGDVAALAERLVWAIDHPERLRALREGAERYVHDHLSWERIARRVTDEVYTPIALELSLSRSG
jgi:glycosyltransferase involved in cell wall biosynthesis